MATDRRVWTLCRRTSRGRHCGDTNGWRLCLQWQFHGEAVGSAAPRKFRYISSTGVNLYRFLLLKVFGGHQLDGTEPSLFRLLTEQNHGPSIDSRYRHWFRSFILLRIISWRFTFTCKQQKIGMNNKSLKITLYAFTSFCQGLPKIWSYKLIYFHELFLLFCYYCPNAQIKQV